MVLVYLQIKVKIKKRKHTRNGPDGLCGNMATTGKATHADEHN